MSNLSLIDRLKSARRVATPLIAISTPDPADTIRQVREAFDGDGAQTPIPIVCWDASNGLTGLNRAGASAVAAVLKSDDVSEWPGLSANPAAACAYMLGLPGEQRENTKLVQRGTIVFMLNGQRFFEDRPNAGDSVSQVIQAVWNLRDAYKADRRTLVALGPAFSFPPELAQDVIAFDEPFPTDAQLKAIVLEQATAAAVTLKDAVVDSSVDALRGLAAFTAEQITAMSIDSKAQTLDVDELWQRKIAVVEQTPGLSVDRGTETFDDVRGLANYREFSLGLIRSKRAPTLYVRIDEIEKSFGGLGQNGGPSDNTGTTQDRLGVMLKMMEDEGWTGLIALGHAGTGKSLVTKAMANTATKETGRKTLSLSLDLGATTGGIVGESERKIRTACKVIKSLAAGGRVCFVATCNDLQVLPPALKRRFKLGTWMFDLPAAEDRDAQWQQYMAKYGLKKQPMPDSTDWTGADIRNVCDVADQLEVPIVKACQFVTFVALSDPEAITRLRRLADGKYVDANKPGIYRAPFTDKQLAAPAPSGRRAAGREE